MDVNVPETPKTRHEASADADVDIADASALQEHSDDDSDLHHDGAKDSTSQHSKDEKVRDAEANYTEESETSYSLFSNPKDLEHIRQKLFDIDEDIELTREQWDEYFPFVDNVWRKYRATESHPEAAGLSEVFCCRLRPSSQQKTPLQKPQVEGKQQRRKRKREDKSCSMFMKITYPDRDRVVISRATGSDAGHTHDLDYMDQNKRNSAIMDVARREAQKGFLPGSIFWKMQEEQDKMDAAGGKFMKVSDVRNVQYPWRQQNMAAVLKAHAGYSQQRSGPRQKSAASAPATPRNGDTRAQKPVQAPVPISAFSPHPNTQPQRPPVPQEPYQQQLPPGTLNYPDHAKQFLQPYIPYGPHLTNAARPHVTLTWASSLDSRLALAPGLQTAISGQETKAMTHFLRSQHDAILIGANTAIYDNPGLNCRLAGAGGFGGTGTAMQPRPVIIDPRGRLTISNNMRLLQAASEGKAKGPWIVVGPTARLTPEAVAILKHHGGEFLQINEIHQHGLDWHHLFSILHREGIRSIMVEGGGKVLSELLNPRYTNIIDSIIITIAPTFFGKNGVEVAPDPAYEGQSPIQTRLVDVRWQPMGLSDVVMCGHLHKVQQAQPRLPGINQFTQHQNAQQGPPSQPPQNLQQQPQTQSQGFVQHAAPLPPPSQSQPPSQHQYQHPHPQSAQPQAQHQPSSSRTGPPESPRQPPPPVQYKNASIPPQAQPQHSQPPPQHSTPQLAYPQNQQAPVSSMHSHQHSRQYSRSQPLPQPQAQPQHQQKQHPPPQPSPSQPPLSQPTQLGPPYQYVQNQLPPISQPNGHQSPPPSYQTNGAPQPRSPIFRHYGPPPAAHQS